MNVSFEVREVLVRDESKPGTKVLAPLEHLVADVHGDGKEVVCRVATDADRELYSSEYRAFKAPPAAPVVAAAPAEAPPSVAASEEETPAASIFGTRPHKPKSK